MTLFGRRSIGALCFVFAAPNAIPLGIPGLPVVLAVPLLVFTWFLMTGRPRSSLPEVVRARSMARRDFARIVVRIMPMLRRLEQWVRPRALWAATGAAERVIGAVGVLMALLIFLPVPFSNNLPGVSLALLSLGLLGRDGLMVGLGLLCAGVSLGIAVGVLYGLVRVAMLTLGGAMAG